MAFKFLHSSDWHFGAGRRLTPKSSDYLDRHVEALRRVLKVAVKEQVDFILVSGDIFESASTTIDELMAAYDIFCQCGEICPTIVTAGNHDELMVGDFQTKWLKLLNIPNVQFVSTPQTIDLKHRGGTTKVLAVPWTGLKVQEDFEEVITSNLEPDTEICMLHECFLGVTLDSGISSKSGVKIPDLHQIRYYAVGDIHKYQRVQLPNAWYCGAPLQYNFGDQLPKGVIVVSVDDQKNYTPNFIQIPSGIELHNISSLEQIPAGSPHWYKLRTEASKIPRHVPSNVKVIEPLASAPMPKAVMGEVEETTTDVSQTLQAVDFTEGVEAFLVSNGFNQAEILDATEQIQKVVQSH